VVIDSILSEEAVLAFEYGYASNDPNTCVIWEAQFGDFVNVAQVVIDQFIASGEVKWGRVNGIVLMLPHGYEGQGPEHSSARLERFMQLSADTNIQVVQPTTASQIFHVLRRQMVRKLRKPLVIMTPKSLLRAKDAASPLSEFTDGGFQTVIPENRPLNADVVKRVLVCSGKVYYDLVKKRAEKGVQDVAIIRVEQLYPFPQDSLAKELAKYPKATFVSSAFKPGANGKVDVVGKLTIKGITQDITAPVTFKQDGANQVFEGALPIKRNAFKVGDGEWKDTSVVADDVTIKFRVVIAKK
jgi:2-oxoglutarate dehydrogenase E1 component